MAQTCRFLIITSPRSGSGWLATSLDSHPDIRCYGELFSKGATGVKTTGSAKSSLQKNTARKLPLFALYRQEQQAKRSRGNLESAYLDLVFSDGGHAKQYRGMTIMYEQLIKHTKVFAYVLRHRIPVIHLVRSSVAESILSRIVSKARGRNHVTETPGILQVRVSPILFKLETIKKIVEIHLARFILRLSPVAVLELEYSELVKDPDVGFAGVLRFIGADDEIQLTSPWKKANPYPPSEIILNYMSVERWFKLRA